jgi:sugar phosphate permease
VEKQSPGFTLFLLIIAGEAIFTIPFVLPRIFRPTVLATFGIDNTELGLCFSVYGIVALFSYLLGGPFADKFQPQKLISLSLWLTALGGVVYATFPSLITLKILYGYWGFSTLFLFWAPMLKATRIWGRSHTQAKAFGLLDGGRGFVSALIGSAGVFLFAAMMPEKVMENLVVTQAAFRQVVWMCVLFVGAAGFLVWFYLRLPKRDLDESLISKITVSQIKEVLMLPSVGMLMLIILCAYVGYKITDIFSLYAKEVMGYSQVQAASVGTALLYARPIIGGLIGFYTPRSKMALGLLISFICSGLGASIFALGWVQPNRFILFIASIQLLTIGVYAVRCLYFAVLETGKIPLKLSGTAIGLISLIGFTPDIFLGPLIGVTLDGNPGIQGHQYVFLLLALFSLIGGLTTYFFYRWSQKQ